MEMVRIVRKAVVGREIHAAAEPPGVAGTEEAHVHVHRRAVGIARMEHERKPHRVVGTASELRARGAGRWRQCRTLHAGHVYAGSLEETAFFQHPCLAATAFGALPG